MIITHGPNDVCLGDWFLITEDSVSRFPTLTRAIVRLKDTRRQMRLDPARPAEFFVHWSMLTDEERKRVLDAA